MNQIGEMRKFTGVVTQGHQCGMEPGDTFRGFYHGNGTANDGYVFYLYEDIDENLRKSSDFQITIRFDGTNGIDSLCKCDRSDDDYDVLNCKCGDKNESQ